MVKNYFLFEVVEIITVTIKNKYTLGNIIKLLLKLWTTEKYVS